MTSPAASPSFPLPAAPRPTPSPPGGSDGRSNDWDLSTRTEVLQRDLLSLSFPPAPDQTLWGTTTKLRQLLEAPVLNNELYFEALGAVLAHELVRLHRI